MSGFRVAEEDRNETGRMSTGNSAVGFEEAYGGWQSGRLTQEEAAPVAGWMLAHVQATYYIDRLRMLFEYRYRVTFLP